MRDVLELQEQLVGATVRTAAELAAIVTEHGFHPDPVLIEERQHVVVHHLHRREGELARVELAPGVASEPIERRLQLHLADPLQRSDEERVHGNEVARAMDFDVALPELRTESLEQLDLLVGQLQLPFPGDLLELQQSLVFSSGRDDSTPHARLLS